MQYVIAYLAAIAAFLLIDLIWLGKIAKAFYRDQLGPLLLERFRFGVAGLFYAVYGIGIVIFAIAPAMAAGRWEAAFGLGALFGFFAYGTYDMTNLATLKRWPVAITVVDIAWGSALTGTAALCGFLAATVYAGI
jgi:uncharacterized membrane protein